MAAKKKPESKMVEVIEVRKVIKPSLETYYRLIDNIVLQLRNNDYIPDTIIAVSRGGLTIGERVSYLLDQPLTVVSAANWPKGQKAPEIKFARHGTYMTEDKPKGRSLVIDDLTETGDSIAGTVNYANHKYPAIVEIKTAVLYHKQSSEDNLIVPDFYAVRLYVDKLTKRVPWILKPTENHVIQLVDEVEYKNVPILKPAPA